MIKTQSRNTIQTKKREVQIVFQSLKFKGL